MPQMAPMNWINLFLSFSLMLITIGSINYFSFNYKTSLTNSYNQTIKINWKW